MRNFENEEIIHSWKKDIKSTVILFALSLIRILCIGFVIVLKLQTDTQVQEYKEMYEDYQYYTIMDNLVGSNATELDNSGSAYKFKKFYDLISSGEYFEYYMMYNQSVYMADYKSNERNIYGYEYSTNLQDKIMDIQGNDGSVREYTNLKGFWIGDNVIEDFKFKFMDGTGFSSKDFYLRSNGNISIILGANYADSYKVGDEVYIDFIFAARKATVVGILEEGTNIYYRGSYRNLDTSVIMPIFENDTYNGASLYSLNVNHYYTFRNSGLVRTKLSCSDVQKIVEGYSKEAYQNVELPLKIRGIGKDERAKAIKPLSW